MLNEIDDADDWAAEERGPAQPQPVRESARRAEADVFAVCQDGRFVLVLRGEPLPADTVGELLAEFSAEDGCLVLAQPEDSAAAATVSPPPRQTQPKGASS